MKTLALFGITGRTGLPLAGVGVNASTSASRKDIAHFITQELTEGKYIRQMPFISR